MTIQIGFILPSARQKLLLSSMQEQLETLRADQLAHFEHLVRSWRIFRHYDGFDLLNKALRRTLRDRP